MRNAIFQVSAFVVGFAAGAASADTWWKGIVMLVAAASGQILGDLIQQGSALNSGEVK